MGGEITEFMYGGEEVVFSVSTTSSQKTLDAAVRQAVPGAFSVSVVGNDHCRDRPSTRALLVLSHTLHSGSVIVRRVKGGGRQRHG